MSFWHFQGGVTLYRGQGQTRSKTHPGAFYEATDTVLGCVRFLAVFLDHSHGRIPGNGGCRKAKQQPCCDRRCRVGLFLGLACNWKQAFISIARGCGGGFPLGGVLVLFFCGGGVYE